MMNQKKIFISLVLIMFFVLFLQGVYSQDSPIPGAQELENDSVLQGARKIQEFNEEKKWEYLGQEWRTFFLKNKYIAAVNGFLKKISFVFLFLFAEPYSLSALLFLVIYLWIIFFFIWGEILTTYSAFSKGISWVMAFAFCVIQSHLQIYKFQANFFFKLILYRGSWWSYLGVAIIVIFYLFIVTFITKALRRVRIKKKKSLDEQQQFDQKILHRTVEGINKANEDIAK